jgi:hypothetical protein
LDAKLLVLSTVSLGIFPFLAFALTSRVFGVRHDEEFVSRFLAHTQALLAHGVAPARPADSDARAAVAPPTGATAAAPHPNSAPAASVHGVIARTRERQ